jgi:hypothetical protein
LTTRHKKNASRVTGIFFVFFCNVIIMKHNTGLGIVGSSVIVTTSVVVGTRIAHQRKPTILARFNMEVGAVIKAGITGTTYTEFVLTALLRTRI